MTLAQDTALDGNGRPAPVRIPYGPLGAAVSLWCCTLSSGRGVEDLAAWLSSAETERSARFGTPALRERYIIGRATLRLLLSNVLGTTPAQVPIARSRRGRPVLDVPGAVDFNVSHTRDLAVYAIGTGLAPGTRVGIDVEHCEREADVARLARKLLTVFEREQLATLDERARRRRFLEIWTCKEAMSKATADGLIAPFAAIGVDCSGEPRLLHGPPPYTPERWQLHRVPMRDGYIVTVALHQS